MHISKKSVAEHSKNNLLFSLTQHFKKYGKHIREYTDIQGRTIFNNLKEMKKTN